jgi:hypothetical protein
MKINKAKKTNQSETKRNKVKQTDLNEKSVGALGGIVLLQLFRFQSC